VSSGPAPSPLGWLERVRVGSMNQPKIAAVRHAIAAFAPNAVVEGAAVESGVPEQPLGFEEIVAGARNRAAAALRASACDLGVGIEDGLVELPLCPGAALSPVNIGCAVVTDGRRTSAGFSSGFSYPPEVAIPALRDRAPIGDLFDALWRERRSDADVEPSGRTTGNVGRLTAGVLTRSEYGRHAVLCALVSFLNPDLFPEGEPGA
jgi:inosine/xanthosine triphosphatase